MAGRRRDRRRRHLGQGGGAVFERKPRRQGPRKSSRSSDFGGSRSKNGLARKFSTWAAETAPARASAPSRSAAAPVCRRTQSSINALPGPVSKARISARSSDPRHVGDAADVEDRDRLRQGCGEGGMVQRSERRSLSARRDVGRAEIGDHIQPEPARQQRAVADLPGAAFGRAMQDRVAVKADHLGGVSRMLTQKIFHRFRMEPGQLLLHIGDRADPAENRPKPFAKFRRIGKGQRGARDAPGRGRRSRSSRRRCRRARCRSSTRSRATCAAECCGPERAPMLDDAAMSTPRSPFLATALERGFIHQCTDMEALDERLRAGRVVAYVGYRLHGGQSACRQPGRDHAAAPVSEMRAQADRADGRRHDADRRSFGQGRGATTPR